MQTRVSIGSTPSQTWVGVGILVVDVTGRTATNHPLVVRFSSRPVHGVVRPVAWTATGAFARPFFTPPAIK